MNLYHHLIVLKYNCPFPPLMSLDPCVLHPASVHLIELPSLPLLTPATCQYTSA